MPSLSRSLTPITPTTTLGEAALAFLTTRKVRTDEDDLRDPTRRDGYSLGGISNLRWGLGFIFSIEFANKTTLAELELRDLKRSHVMIWLEQISRSPQRSAEYTALNAMKRLIRWCADADALSLDVVKKIRTKYRARKGPAVTGEHREALRLVLARRRSSVDPSSSDVAVLRGTLETGARCVEIRKARVKHFFAGPVPTLRYEAGKSGEPRIVVLSRSFARTIRERIVNCPPHVALDEDVEADPRLLPAEYQRWKVEPDKAAILATLKENGQVPGASLARRQRVEVEP